MQGIFRGQKRSKHCSKNISHEPLAFNSKIIGNSCPPLAHANIHAQILFIYLADTVYGQSLQRESFYACPVKYSHHCPLYFPLAKANVNKALADYSEFFSS